MECGGLENKQKATNPMKPMKYTMSTWGNLLLIGMARLWRHQQSQKKAKEKKKRKKKVKSRKHHHNKDISDEGGVPAAASGVEHEGINDAVDLETMDKSLSMDEDDEFGEFATPSPVRGQNGAGDLPDTR